MVVRKEKEGGIQTRWIIKRDTEQDFEKDNGDVFGIYCISYSSWAFLGTGQAEIFNRQKSYPSTKYHELKKLNQFEKNQNNYN